MGTVSAIPNNLYAYTKACAPADHEAAAALQASLPHAIDAFVRGAAATGDPNHAAVDTSRAGALLSGLTGQIHDALKWAYETDSYVHTVGQAFELAGNSSPTSLLHDVNPVYTLDESFFTHLDAGGPFTQQELNGIRNIAKFSNDAPLRSQANMVLLYQQLTTLQNELKTDPGDRAEIQNQIDELNAIKDMMQPGDVPHYLLQFDTWGPRGHAAIASGDPYSAATKNVMTAVFGMTTQVTGMAGDLANDDKLFNAANTMDPNNPTAVITWYGYTTPRLFPVHGDVQFTQEAKTGGELLNQFQGQLAALRNGLPTNMTVVAHSYGGEVAGFAATHPGGLYANNVVYLGSVGTSEQGLNNMLNSGVHVYSARYGNDIAAAMTGFEPLGHWIPGGDLTAQLTDPNKKTDVDQLQTGSSVSRPDLAHTHYWEDPTTVKNLSEIITGAGQPPLKAPPLEHDPRLDWLPWMPKQPITPLP